MANDALISPKRLARNQVLGLGTTQTIAWASSYYLPAILAEPMAADLGVQPGYAFIPVSLALVLSALISPMVGHHIDRRGGRRLLVASSVCFSLGLLLLALAQGPVLLGVSWLVLGLAMGGGLYEAAFATLVRYEGSLARSSIITVTLMAGFASTIGWPLTAALSSAIGWRGACVVWAVAHLVVALPVHLALPKAVPSQPGHPLTEASSQLRGPSRRALPWLAVAFAGTWFVATGMATHLPRLFVLTGLTLPVAVACAALVGPAQVAARILEATFLRRFHPLWSARVAALAHPLGAMALWCGAPLALAAGGFALFHGAGNGILTIAKGTLPLVLFGSAGYGRLQGWLTVPARLAQAAAPLAYGLAIDGLGPGVWWLSAACGALVFLCLLRVRA
jgi:predicted MFS family arabinose efflux permease